MKDLINFFSRFFKTKRRDFMILYISVISCLGYIAIKTHYFRKGIQFGILAFAKAPALKLIQFSSTQVLFAILYWIQDSVELMFDCPPEFFAENQRVPCHILDITWPIIYQCWIWFAVVFNWQMFSVGRGNENKKPSENYSNHSMTQTLSSDSITYSVEFGNQLSC